MITWIFIPVSILQEDQLPSISTWKWRVHQSFKMSIVQYAGKCFSTPYTEIRNIEPTSSMFVGSPAIIFVFIGGTPTPIRILSVWRQSHWCSKIFTWTCRQSVFNATTITVPITIFYVTITLGPIPLIIMTLIKSDFRWELYKLFAVARLELLRQTYLTSFEHTRSAKCCTAMGSISSFICVVPIVIVIRSARTTTFSPVCRNASSSRHTYTGASLIHIRHLA